MRITDALTSHLNTAASAPTDLCEKGIMLWWWFPSRTDIFCQNGYLSIEVYCNVFRNSPNCFCLVPRSTAADTEVGVLNTPCGSLVPWAWPPTRVTAPVTARRWPLCRHEQKGSLRKHYKSQIKSGGKKINNCNNMPIDSLPGPQRKVLFQIPYPWEELERCPS